jgi:mycoredoxin
MSETITMYSTPWCGYCKRLKVALESDGIHFVEVDITQDAEAERFVIGVNDGDATVPTLRFADGSVLTNPTAAQVRKQLAGPQPKPSSSLF